MFLIFLLFNYAKVELGSSCQIVLSLLATLHITIITVDLFLIFLLFNNAKVELCSPCQISRET